MPDRPQHTRTTRPVALITGGGSGLGRALALDLAQQGYDLALAGRRPEPLGAVATVATRLGVQAAAFPADLTAPDVPATLVARVRAALGPPTLLVHAAGVLAGGELTDLTPAAIQQAVTTNLTAPMMLTQAALPDLRANQGGVILLASLLADVPFPAASLYSATKAGLAAFGESLRYELGAHGGKVLVAYPPGTATTMTAGMARAVRFPGYRLADPAAVSAAIIAAYVGGRREWRPGGGDRALSLAHQFAPRLTRPLLRSQRVRCRRMLTTPADRD